MKIKFNDIRQMIRDEVMQAINFHEREHSDRRCYLNEDLERMRERICELEVVVGTLQVKNAALSAFVRNEITQEEMNQRIENAQDMKTCSKGENATCEARW